MNLIYIFFALIIVLQISRRRFDFLSIAAVSFVLYTSNCITGRVWIEGGRLGTYYQSNIIPLTYMLIICQMLIIILSMHISFINGKAKWSRSIIQEESLGYEEYSEAEHTHFYWDVLLIFSVFEFIYTIFFQIGILSFFSYTRKNDLYEMTGVLYSLAVWGSVLCFMYGIQKGKKVFSIISMILILVTVISGSRAYLATALVGYIVIRAKKIKKVKVSNRRMIVLGIIAFFFLLFYKNIYSEVRALDFGAVYKIITSPETYANILDINEFRITTSIYNYVVEEGFRLPVGDSIARLVSIIPFINNVIPTSYSLRFSSIAMNDFFGASYGLANSFWAEIYAMGGILLLMIVTGIWLHFIKWYNNFINGKAKMSPFALTIAAYCSFYIHRLDWLQVWGCIKSVLVFYLIWLAINRIRVK